MNNGIAESDFNYIHWEKDSGGPEAFELLIYGKSEQDCEKKKQLILNNQRVIDKIKIIFDDGSVNNDTFFPKLEKILNITLHSKCSGGNNHEL